MHENFICLSGLRDLTEIAHVGVLNTGKVYNSKHKCLLHANCYAIPCAWPIDQMLYDWNNKSKCKSAILREATTCYKCSAEGKYLCVFGGHMLCENHVEPFVLTNKRTKSPNQCSCKESGGSPVWPNPFVHMYMPSNALILHDGDTVANYSYVFFLLKFGLNSKITVKSWMFFHDTMPKLHTIDKTIKKKRIIAWRIAVISSVIRPLNLLTM